MECPYCEQEMKKHVGCTEGTVTFPDGKEMPAVPHDHEQDCGDCLCPQGSFHHPGCDMERCPQCSGQLISCDCLREDEDEEE